MDLSSDTSSTAFRQAALNARLEASLAGHAEPGVIAALLEEGANPNARFDSGNRPLHLACLYATQFDQKHCYAVVALLLKAGARMTEKNSPGTPPVYYAISCSNLPALRALLDFSPGDVHASTPDGDPRETPLHYAALHAVDIRPLQLLLEAGFDPDVANGHGETPLHLAARCGHDPAVQLLIEKGASVDKAATPANETPLFSAVYHDRVSCALTLLRAGADPNRVSSANGRYSMAGWTPLGVAIGRRLPLMEALLIDHGARYDLVHRPRPDFFPEEGRQP